MAEANQGGEPPQPPQLPGAIVDQPQQPAPFALTPGQVNPGQYIDYSTRVGTKYWDEATAPLLDRYNVDSAGANQFCEKVKDRAEKSGWYSTNANIISIPNENATAIDLIDGYGRLTMDDVRNHVTGYISQQTRQAQNAVQMYHFLIDSLSEQGRLHIITEKKAYTVSVAGIEYPNGPMLFKLIMSKAIIDTRSTSSHIQANLMNLPSYISTIDSDIIRFNEYVKIQRAGLLARGKTVDDLLLCLFNGYMAASDATFVKYIQNHFDQYNDGTRDYTVDGLMTMALNKYEDMVRDNTWNAMSPEQEQIVALSATVDKIKDANLKLSRKLTAAAGTTGGSSSNTRTTSNQGTSSSNTGNQGKKKKSNRAKQNEKYAWKKVKPKDSDPKTTVNGKTYFVLTKGNKTYYWCEWHEAWVMHLPEDEGENGCKLRKQIQNEESNNFGRHTRFSSALATIMDEVEGQGDEE
jgi:hypothetical protein